MLIINKIIILFGDIDGFLELATVVSGFLLRFCRTELVIIGLKKI